jgi:two-component system, OmpR family, sensor histidine kinase KdpD
MMRPDVGLQPAPSILWKRETWVVPALLAGATLLSFALDQYVSLTSQAMVYVLAVVVASYALPRAASVVSAVAAVILLNFFFVPPRYTFHVESHENLAALFAMLAVALVISHLGTALRRETEAAHLNEGRARQLQELATALASCSQALDVHVLAQRFLSRAFSGPCLVSPLTAEGDLHLPTEGAATFRDGMLACIREAATLGPGTGRWPGLNAWYLPLQAQGHISGAACVQNVSAYDHAGRDHAQAICALVGQALWRLTLAASVHAAEEQSQWHKAQSTFLAAISHDFRTPLASIMGAASSLQAQRDKLSTMEQERLATTILNESLHLATLTENTLQLVRLDNAGDINLDWQSVEEVVGAVLSRVRARDVTRRIRSSVPPGLPLIKADPVLLTQLLENLLDNALKYSADTVELVVSHTDQHLQVAVHDRGNGIPAGEELAIFEPYHRGDRSGQRGAGLGLAVCRAIARAHGGELTMAPRAGGGSSFVLKLPVVAQPTAEPA